ncbi:hypothetical protein D3C81_2002080 [compost metagenome]
MHVGAHGHLLHVLRYRYYFCLFLLSLPSAAPRNAALRGNAGGGNVQSRDHALPDCGERLCLVWTDEAALAGGLDIAAAAAVRPGARTDVLCVASPSGMGRRQD